MQGNGVNRPMRSNSTIERMKRVPGFALLAERFSRALTPEKQYRLIVDLLVALEPEHSFLARLPRLRQDVLRELDKIEKESERMDLEDVRKEQREVSKRSRESRRPQRPLPPDPSESERLRRGRKIFR